MKILVNQSQLVKRSAACAHSAMHTVWVGGKRYTQCTHCGARWLIG